MKAKSLFILLSVLFIIPTSAAILNKQRWKHRGIDRIGEPATENPKHPHVLPLLLI